MPAESQFATPEPEPQPQPQDTLPKRENMTENEWLQEKAIEVSSLAQSEMNAKLAPVMLCANTPEDYAKMQSSPAASGGNITYAPSSQTNTRKGHTEKLVLWDECKGKITSQYNDDQRHPLHCKKTPMSKTLAEKLDKHLLVCVQGAAAKILGLPSGVPATMWFGHMGVLADSRHESASLHSVSRAIDVNEIRFEHDGKRYKIDYNQASDAYDRFEKRGRRAPQELAQQYRFFQSLQQCWNTMAPPRGGSVAFGHKGHKNHIHLSVPLPNPGFFSN